ncbi:MAG: ABC transporter permease [Leptospiraceae bacterium]|nr:ABC transporter permease [Leptospiraceae bacterium]
MALIELRNIFKNYKVGEMETPVLRGISLEIDRGEYVALMGTSGSGKTTLMNILGCLDRQTSGNYILDGYDVGKLSLDERAMLRNKKIGFVFQNFNLLARTNALNNVMMPLSYSTEQLSDEEVNQRAQEVLRKMKLENRIHHEPSQLSGGQQQRVAIARALITRPSILFADEPTGNLDSRTSEEVLNIFSELNEKEGVTIILVTHDENVARHAKRVVRIKDGLVESDGKSRAGRNKAKPFVTHEQLPEQAHLGSGGEFWRFKRLIYTAYTGLSRNVVRAALTALGIIIGVSAVIAMMEIGKGSAVSIQETISSMGANSLLILPGTASSGGISYGAGTNTTLTPQDAEAISKDCPVVRAVAPTVRARTQVVFQNKNWVPSYIYGTTPAFLEVREWNLSSGAPFTDRDVRNSNKVCILGQTLVRELFQNESPIGKEVRLNNVPFIVIGVLNFKGANMMGMDQDDVLIAPWTTIKFRVSGSTLSNVNQSAATTSTDSTQQVNTLSKLYPGSSMGIYPSISSVQAANSPMPVHFTNVDQIMTATRQAKDIPIAIQQITKVLRERHRIHENEENDFNIRDMTEMTKALSSTSTMMTNLLLVVAMISLIVGGVGIMNIMLVSVTERTKEIGLRMAVGAKSGNILQQFLIEAIALCFFGGAIGIFLGRSVSILVRMILHWPTEISPEAIISAFVVSAMVGIIFGYYPAWKASRLDPISALRYE